MRFLTTYIAICDLFLYIVDTDLAALLNGKRCYAKIPIVIFCFGMFAAMICIFKIQLLHGNFNFVLNMLQILVSFNCLTLYARCEAI